MPNHYKVVFIVELVNFCDEKIHCIKIYQQNPRQLLNIDMNMDGIVYSVQCFGEAFISPVWDKIYKLYIHLFTIIRIHMSLSTRLGNNRIILDNFILLVYD